MFEKLNNSQLLFDEKKLGYRNDAKEWSEEKKTMATDCEQVSVPNKAIFSFSHPFSVSHCWLFFVHEYINNNNALSLMAIRKPAVEQMRYEHNSHV